MNPTENANKYTSPKKWIEFINRTKLKRGENKQKLTGQN